jgi:hypothetical protein
MKMKPRDQIHQSFELNRARSSAQRIVQLGPFLPLHLVAEDRNPAAVLSSHDLLAPYPERGGACR